jgi:hypothetical protein
VSVTDLQETSNAERGVMTQLLEVHNQRDELVSAAELVALLRWRNR